MQWPKRSRRWVWLMLPAAVVLVLAFLLIFRGSDRPATLADIDPAITPGMTQQQVESILVESGLDTRWVAAERTYYAIERVRDQGPSAWTRRRLVIVFNDQGEVASVNEQVPSRQP